MSEAYIISSYAKNDRDRLCRFKTYKADNMFVRAYHLAYTAEIIILKRLNLLTKVYFRRFISLLEIVKRM